MSLFLTVAHTLSPLPQPTSHSHCVFNPGLFCGRIPHEDSRFCGSLFFSQGLPCSSVTPSLFFSICMEMPPCVCVSWACPPAVCAGEHMHTHTHIWVNRHAIPSEPGNARDYGKRCDYYPDFFFCCFVPPPSSTSTTTSFVFDKRSIDPSWPGVLCSLTVKKQAAETHDYCGYFWRTSMHLIFHLLKHSSCSRPPLFFSFFFFYP